MIDNAPAPEVQIVMDMDGFGPPSEKLNTYEACIDDEPVQLPASNCFIKTMLGQDTS